MQRAPRRFSVSEREELWNCCSHTRFSSERLVGAQPRPQLILHPAQAEVEPLARLAEQLRQLKKQMGRRSSTSRTNSCATKWTRHRERPPPTSNSASPLPVST